MMRLINNCVWTTEYNVAIKWTNRGCVKKKKKNLEGQNLWNNGFLVTAHQDMRNRQVSPTVSWFTSSRNFLVCGMSRGAQVELTGLPYWNKRAEPGDTRAARVCGAECQRRASCTERALDSFRGSVAGIRLSTAQHVRKLPKARARTTPKGKRQQWSVLTKGCRQYLLPPAIGRPCDSWDTE